MRINLSILLVLLFLASACTKKQVNRVTETSVDKTIEKQNIPALPTQTDDERYQYLVEKAAVLLGEEKYDSCIGLFKEAFTIRQVSYLSTLRNAACAHSLGDMAYRDEQLKIAFDLNWGSTKSIFDNYPDFEYLKPGPFQELIEKMYIDYATEAGVDLVLMKKFETIQYEDQRYRKEMRPIQQKYGWDSPQMDSLWVLQNKADSINTVRIVEVIEERGYPGKSIVGPGLAGTAFLVIQHADLEIQEKYLPIIKKAGDEEEVRWSSVAMLIDRVNMRNGKPQIYGSQVNTHPVTKEYFFAEIEQPLKIDSIRATVGLGPLQSYADNWDFTWDPENNARIVKEVKAIKEKEALEKKE